MTYACFDASNGTTVHVHCILFLEIYVCYGTWYDFFDSKSVCYKVSPKSHHKYLYMYIPKLYYYSFFKTKSACCKSKAIPCCYYQLMFLLLLL